MTFLALSVTVALILSSSAFVATPDKAKTLEAVFDQLGVIAKAMNTMQTTVNATEIYARSVDEKFYNLEKQLYILQREQNVVEGNIQKLQTSVGPSYCAAVYALGGTSPGVYEINVTTLGVVRVWCEDGWTTFQRRKTGDLSFDRSLAQYEAGFGRPDGDVWLGLRALHVMTSQLRRCRLRAELTPDPRHGNIGVTSMEASTFSVGAGPGYRLTATGISGPSWAKYMESIHSGMQFTTRDSDRDEKSSANCALDRRWMASASAGGWYNDCGLINLNGVTNYASSVSNKIRARWYPHTLSGVELKLKC